LGRPTGGFVGYTVDLKFKVLPDHIYFSFKVRFTFSVLKMVSVRVHFTPGFLSGAGFSVKQIAPAWF
jgi:hypothetical protein